MDMCLDPKTLAARGMYADIAEDTLDRVFRNDTSISRNDSTQMLVLTDSEHVAVLALHRNDDRHVLSAHVFKDLRSAFPSRVSYAFALTFAPVYHQAKGGKDCVVKIWYVLQGTLYRLRR